MRLTAFIVNAFLLLTLTAHGQTTTGANPNPNPPDAEIEEEMTERALSVEPDAVVNLCLESGSVVVRGSDSREVRVRADAARLELRGEAGARPPAQASQASQTPGAQKPSKNVEVWVSDSEDDERVSGICAGSGNVELEMPRGATLILKLHNGDIDVSDIAEAHIQSLNGDTEVRRVTRAADIQNISGSITLSDSSGRVRLQGVSSDIDASNVRAAGPADQFSAKTTSGSVTLDRVTHSRVEAGTVSGDVNVTGTGALARDGSYDFKTFSGDVTVTLPADASFKLNAIVASGGEISTDFIVKSDTGAQSLKEPAHGQGRLHGTVGSNGAHVNLASFNGSLRLKKR
ncbi:MAG TPA: DUF4097 family beta strand repeat-containing protein [Pyrinomonadaceae bacterium]|jgi:DUF4097 and DUF4098 domain-containing protein YvlB